MTLDRYGYAAFGPIYDAAIDQSRWQVALDATCLAAGAKGAVLLVVDDESDAYNVRAFSGLYAAMFKTDAAQYYLDHLAHYEAAEWDMIGRQRAQRLMLDSEMIDPEVLDQREDCRFLRKHAGIRRRVGVRLNDSRISFDAMTLQYDARIAAIPPASLRRLQPLLPHLAKSVEMHRTFAQLRARYAAVLAVLDNVLVGLAVAKASGEVIVSNTEADRILGLSDGISLSKDQRLVCRGPDQTEMLRAFIHDAARTACGRADRPESLIAVPRPSGSHPFLVEVAPISDSFGELDFNLAGAIITIIDPDNTPDLDIDRFARLHGLTGAEAAVCGHLVSGLTGPAIAEIRSTSPDTVRSQIAAILVKTGTSRRSQLIRLVVRTLPPVG